MFGGVDVDVGVDVGVGVGVGVGVFYQEVAKGIVIEVRRTAYLGGSREEALSILRVLLVDFFRQISMPGLLITLGMESIKQ